MSALDKLTDPDRKRFETLRAVAYLQPNGPEVRVFLNDQERPEFLITQYALTAFCSTVDDLEKHLRRFGVKAAEPSEGPSA